MSNLPVSYNPGESILREEEKTLHVKNNPLGIGYNIIYGTFWLTSQRIVFQSAALGSLTVYPIHHIVSATRAEVSIANRAGRYSTTSFDAALYLEFDDGGKEYFIPADISGWATAIMDAKAIAPALPFIQTPPSRSAVQDGNRGLWVMLGIFGAIVLCFMCSVAACVGFPFLLSLLGSSGG